MNKERVLEGYRSLPEFAAFMGKSVPTIRRWVELGEAPPVTKIGRDPYFRNASTEQWLAAREGVGKMKVEETPATKRRQRRGHKARIEARAVEPLRHRISTLLNRFEAYESGMQVMLLRLAAIMKRLESYENIADESAKMRDAALTADKMAEMLGGTPGSSQA